MLNLNIIQDFIDFVIVRKKAQLLRRNLSSSSVTFQGLSKNNILDLQFSAKFRAGFKTQGAQESVDFVDIGLNQPYGKLPVNFVDFTIEEDNFELPAKRSAFTLIVRSVSKKIVREPTKAPNLAHL